MGSALQALLINGPLLKKLKLTRVDFTGSSIGIFSSLANHPTLESFNLNIEMPATEAKSASMAEECKFPASSNHFLKRFRVRTFRKKALTAEWLSFIQMFDKL